MARVYVYSRVSTPRQIEGFGLSRQKDIVNIRKWCELNAHKPEDVLD
jgi:hypothetical protein